MARCNCVNAPDLLGIMFVGLQLAGIIEWSWWWVTAPFWVQLILAIFSANDEPNR